MNSSPRTLEGAARVLVQGATASGYEAAWWMVQRAPERVARRAFDRVADWAYERDTPKIRRLRANLRRVVSRAELESATHEGVRSYLRYWCESFRLPCWDMEDVVARTQVAGRARLEEALGRAGGGGGAVAALGHMGNWDWAGAWACREIAPLMTVAEKLRPERLYDRFVSQRERLGMHVLPLTGGQPPMRRLGQWVAGGGLVCLLADRDLSRSSIVVDFLGEKARVPAGPAVLAERHGADLLPVTLHYEGEQMSLTIHPAQQGTVTERTQSFMDLLAAAIVEHPTDWHMMQCVFVDDLDSTSSTRW